MSYYSYTSSGLIYYETGEIIPPDNTYMFCHFLGFAAINKI